MSKRKSRKPTERTADLPLESKGRQNKFEPREKWSRLRLWVWRLQMKVAKSIRRSRKWLASKVGSLVKGVQLPGWVVRLSSRLGSRFSTSKEFTDSVNDAAAGLMERPGGGLRSTLFRRSVQVATVKVESYLTFPKRLFPILLGRECYVCSGPHSTVDCVSMLATELGREDEYVVSIRHRLPLVVDELDRVEELLRLGTALRRRDLILRKRARGLAYVVWCIAKFGLGSGVVAPLKIILRTASLADDLWYTMTGRRFASVPRYTQVFNRMWELRTLMDYVEAVRVANPLPTRSPLSPERNFRDNRRESKSMPLVRRKKKRARGPDAGVLDPWTLSPVDLDRATTVSVAASDVADLSSLEPEDLTIRFCDYLSLALTPMEDVLLQQLIIYLQNIWAEVDAGTWGTVLRREILDVFVTQESRIPPESFGRSMDATLRYVVSLGRFVDVFGDRYTIISKVEWSSSDLLITVGSCKVSYRSMRCLDAAHTNAYH